MITVTEIVKGVQVHTSISGDLKAVVAELSRTTKVPQSVIFNTAIARGLTGMSVASSNPEAVNGHFKKKATKATTGTTRKVAKKKATPQKRK